MNNKNNATGGGLGLGGVLGVIFIVLKLVGVIDWSWWWVLSPFWISAVLAILCIVGVLFYCVVIAGTIKTKRKRWQHEERTMAYQTVKTNRINSDIRNQQERDVRKRQVCLQ